MSRSERLFELLQALRRHRRPVSGRRLAEELGISIRTLYRDIAALQGQGAEIEGEPGVGYILRPGFMLPPLMFSEEEIEALVLGSRWVAERTDDPLGAAATNALAKIAAVLPADLRDGLEASGLLVGPGMRAAADSVDLAVIRKAIRSERKLAILYRDADGVVSERVIWPVALGYFERVRVAVAWCELREGFRHFRTDRIARLEPLGARYPRRRQALLKAWREAEASRRRHNAAAGNWQHHGLWSPTSERQETQAMRDPNYTILYVDSPEASGRFYRSLLDREPIEESPTFVLFALGSGLMLGLWSRHTVEPAATAAGGGGEIAMTVESRAAIDATHADWRARGLSILQEPTEMDFGRTFVALDPDGHRLRVFHPTPE